MKRTILNLGTVISRDEQKHIIGGDLGTCAYYNGETGNVIYHISSSYAQELLSHASDHWCCNSCGSASWYDSTTAWEELLNPMNRPI